MGLRDLGSTMSSDSVTSGVRILSSRASMASRSCCKVRFLTGCSPMQIPMQRAGAVKDLAASSCPGLFFCLLAPADPQGKIASIKARGNSTPPLPCFAQSEPSSAWILCHPKGFNFEILCSFFSASLPFPFPLALGSGALGLGAGPFPFPFPLAGAGSSFAFASGGGGAFPFPLPLAGDFGVSFSGSFSGCFSGSFGGGGGNGSCFGKSLFSGPLPSAGISAIPAALPLPEGALGDPAFTSVLPRVAGFMGSLTALLSLESPLPLNIEFGGGGIIASKDIPLPLPKPFPPSKGVKDAGAPPNITEGALPIPESAEFEIPAALRTCVSSWISSS
mmetsp:Transcript_119893/g.224123  ORF Transcript_119893/g.224123 Transcript_119893/m.224123 type:complete len:333 (+) Transcript_119893:314-1312(+)